MAGRKRNNQASQTRRRARKASETPRTARIVSLPDRQPARGSWAGRGAAGKQVSSVRIGDLNIPEPPPDRPNRPKAHRRWLPWLVGVLVLALVLLGGGWALYNSSLFPIEQIRVSGAEHLTDDDLTDLAAVPSNSTLLRVDAYAIEQRLESDPWIKQAHVNRTFPDTLELSIEERDISAIVQVTSVDDQQTENWAIASDGMWLMSVPERGSAESKGISAQVYDDAENVLHITDIPYGVKPAPGSYCTDASVNNALDIVSGLTTDLAQQVTTVSATDTVNTILTLENGIQIAFGTAEDIRDKERVCLELMERFAGQIAYINVRVADRPTWRSV